VVTGLDASSEALENEDVDYFFSALPARERWRAFADFGSQFAAVDIETTGMSVYDHITVIGVELGGRYETFIRGSNLEDAAGLISSAAGLITFNGALFDLPFLKRTFPGLELPAAHVDLRFLSRRVGWAGSLKAVEQLADLKRSEELEDISGYGATVLWSQFEHGDLDALEQLVLYNAADTCVLRPLADLVTDRLRDDLEALRREEGSADTPSLFEDRLPTKRTPRETKAFMDPLPEISRTQRSLRVGAITVRLPPRQSVKPLVTLHALRARMAEPDCRIVGIDLTGSEARPTGWAVLEGDVVLTGVLGSTEEIINRTLACRPTVVSIDSPLSIPIGRDCTDDSCACRAVGGIMRHCERELKRRGVNVYPCLIQSMQALTRRGMEIAGVLRQAGIEVIESYPGAAQDIMRIPRKRASQDQLREGLVRFGLRGIRATGQITHDELDAITSAAVGSFFLADAYEGIGNPEEGYLIIPSLEGRDFTETHEDPPRNAVLVITGEGAAAWVKKHRRAHATTLEQLVRHDLDLLVADHPTDYFRAIAEIGPRARGFWIAPEGQRLSRRPSMFDDQRRGDSEDIDSALAAWVKAGKSLCR
jgi:uncharacterized protein YprB with RNaseH-like and TPR domain/predicted nuclease with RNAse H fold